MRNKSKTIIILILIMFVFLICFIGIKNYNQDNNEENYLINETNSNNTLNQTNEIDPVDEMKYDNISNIEEDQKSEYENIEIDLEEEDEGEEQYLIFDIRLSTYFLTKYCLETFYDNNTMNAKLNLIDSDALLYYNGSLFDWIDKNIYQSAFFAIDEIYVQLLSEDIEIFLVYYRYTTDYVNCNNSVMAIRVDTNSCTFSMYPYEYLQANNYDKLTFLDKIDITNVESIKENTYNKYDMDEIERTGEACTEELFEKLQFDVLVDQGHLYDMLDEEYKEIKFPTYEDFEEYIEKNKDLILYEKLTKYRVSKYSEYVQFSGITNNDRYITFEAPESLMNYSIYLDNYTVVLISTYEKSYETWKASYCLERIFSAINEKDYHFVYENLSPIQKNNYYKTEEEFVEYIKSILYNSNSFEVDDVYLIISDYVYQFTVYVTNNEDTSQTMTLTMTITVKDETDFYVAIVKD